MKPRATNRKDPVQIEEEDNEEANKAAFKVNLKPVTQSFNSWRGVKTFKKTNVDPSAPVPATESSKIASTRETNSPEKLSPFHRLHKTSTVSDIEDKNIPKRRFLKRSKSVNFDSKPQKKKEKFVIQIINFVAIKVLVEEDEEEIKPEPIMEVMEEPRVRTPRKVQNKISANPYRNLCTISNFR